MFFGSALTQSTVPESRVLITHSCRRISLQKASHSSGQGYRAVLSLHTERMVFTFPLGVEFLVSCDNRQDVEVPKVGLLELLQ